MRSPYHGQPGGHPNSVKRHHAAVCVTEDDRYVAENGRGSQAGSHTLASSLWSPSRPSVVGHPRSPVVGCTLQLGWSQREARWWWWWWLVGWFVYKGLVLSPLPLWSTQTTCAPAGRPWPRTCPVAGWEAGQNRKAAGQPFSAAAKPGQRLASTCGDCSRSTHLGSFRSFRVFPVIQPPPVWNPQTRATTGEPMAMRTQRQEKHASRR